MKKKLVLDQDEELLNAEYEHGAFRRVKNQNMTRKEAMEAAPALHTQGRPDQYSIIDRRP